MEEEQATIESQFLAYAKLFEGKTRSGETITLWHSDYWLRQGNIIDDRKVTMTDTGIIFNNFGKSEINFDEWMQLITELCELRELDLEKIIETLTNCGLPGESPVEIPQYRTFFLTYKSKTAMGDGIFCNATCDGYLCWPSTPAGETLYQNCPNRLLSNEKNCAFRRCGPDGLWLGRHLNDTSPKGWTNYTPCFPALVQQILDKVNEDEAEAQLKFETAVNTRIIEMVGIVSSFLTICAAIIIFNAFPSLHNRRTVIHRNLFYALLMEVTVRMVLYTQQSNSFDDVDPEEEDPRKGIEYFPYVCEGAYVLLEYSRLVVYGWMFIEGIFLNTLISANTLRNEIPINYFYTGGWGVPAILIAIWATVVGRHYSKESINTCWYGYNYLPSYYIIQGPILAVVSINMLFLGTIMSVIIMKLRRTNDSELRKIQKTIRATLILLPLLGIINIFNLFDYPLDGSSTGFAIWAYFTHFFRSFQGVFISFIYCFSNGEVRKALKKKWERRVWFRFRWLERRQALPAVLPRQRPIFAIADNENVELVPMPISTWTRPSSTHIVSDIEAGIDTDVEAGLGIGIEVVIDAKIDAIIDTGIEVDIEAGIETGIKTAAIEAVTEVAAIKFVTETAAFKAVTGAAAIEAITDAAAIQASIEATDIEAVTEAAAIQAGIEAAAIVADIEAAAIEASNKVDMEVWIDIEDPNQDDAIADNENVELVPMPIPTWTRPSSTHMVSDIEAGIDTDVEAGLGIGIEVVIDAKIDAIIDTGIEVDIEAGIETGIKAAAIETVTEVAAIKFVTETAAIKAVTGAAAIEAITDAAAIQASIEATDIEAVTEAAAIQAGIEAAAIVADIEAAAIEASNKVDMEVWIDIEDPNQDEKMPISTPRHKRYRQPDNQLAVPAVGRLLPATPGSPRGGLSPRGLPINRELPSTSGLRARSRSASVHDIDEEREDQPYSMAQNLERPSRAVSPYPRYDMAQPRERRSRTASPYPRELPIPTSRNVPMSVPDVVTQAMHGDQRVPSPELARPQRSTSSALEEIRTKLIRTGIGAERRGSPEKHPRSLYSTGLSKSRDISLDREPAREHFLEPKKSRDVSVEREPAREHFLEPKKSRDVSVEREPAREHFLEPKESKYLSRELQEREIESEYFAEPIIPAPIEYQPGPSTSRSRDHDAPLDFGPQPSSSRELSRESSLDSETEHPRSSYDTRALAEARDDLRRNINFMTRERIQMNRDLDPRESFRRRGSYDMRAVSEKWQEEQERSARHRRECLNGPCTCPDAFPYNRHYSVENLDWAVHSPWQRRDEFLDSLKMPPPFRQGDDIDEPNIPWPRRDEFLDSLKMPPPFVQGANITEPNTSQPSLPDIPYPIPEPPRGLPKMLKKEKKKEEKRSRSTSRSSSASRILRSCSICCSPVPSKERGMQTVDQQYEPPYSKYETSSDEDKKNSGLNTIPRRRAKVLKKKKAVGSKSRSTTALATKPVLDLGRDD